MLPSDEDRLRWITRAENLVPVLNKRREYPVSALVLPGNAAVCALAPATPEMGSIPWDDYTIGAGIVLWIDFGQHLVGYLHFRLAWVAGALHAPVQLRFSFGESLRELEFQPQSFAGLLCSSWIQEEIITVDRLEENVVLPRRYAFSCLKIEFLAAGAPIRLRELFAETVSSADFSRLVPWNSGNRCLDEIDRACVKTLAQCMQSVLEDGPKRDRRLWLGDLRLQALTNGVTFRDWRIVERSLYLLAAGTSEDGLIPASVFDYPTPAGACRILDYALLLGDVLLHHGLTYNRWEIVRDLYPLALRQLDFFRESLDANGNFQNREGFWLFIDWNPDLNRDASLHGVYIHALRRNAELAKLLGDGDTGRELALEARNHTLVMRSRITKDGLVLSGPEKQFSYATQVWMILSGVFSREEAGKVLDSLETSGDCLRPVSPYLWHHYVEACCTAGHFELALECLQSYWGEMIRGGADTFWEVFVPGDPDFSPYGDVRLNSCCHAWSCTPSYFLRDRLFRLKSVRKEKVSCQ